MNVLIVEDDTDQANLLKLALESENKNSTIVYDGKQALDVIEKDEFDLVICDLNIPLINGTTLLKKSRGLKIFTPFILMSGYFPSGFIQKTKSNYSDVEFLEKPIEVEEIVRMMEVFA